MAAANDPGPSGNKARRRREPSPLLLLGAGAEVGLVTAAMCLLGWWIDTKLGTFPILLLVGAAMGIVGGLYNLYRVAKRFF
ncbi:MAG: AtpZ/AtpI family protein [Phycisphaeraceae bacterium]